jgi:hypothetical protein
VHFLLLTLALLSSPEPEPEPGMPPAKLATFWSGVGAASAGAILMIFEATRGSTDTRCLYVGDAIDSCDPRSTFRPTSSGLLLLPLGYSLFATGAIWSLGSLIFDGDDPPWLAIAAGVLLGGSAYAISAVVGS